MTLKITLAAVLAAAAFAALGGAQAKPQTEFAVIFHESAEGFAQRTGPKAESYWSDWSAYIGNIQQSGAMTSGSALREPALGWTDAAAPPTVRPSGFLVVKAASLSEAVELVKGSPARRMGGWMEVRPLLPMVENGGGSR
jgi:hypothetical protein